jgi:hypothetical protein
MGTGLGIDAPGAGPVAEVGNAQGGPHPVLAAVGAAGGAFAGGAIGAGVMMVAVQATLASPSPTETTSTLVAGNAALTLGSLALPLALVIAGGAAGGAMGGGVDGGDGLATALTAGFGATAGAAVGAAAGIWAGAQPTFAGDPLWSVVLYGGVVAAVGGLGAALGAAGGALGDGGGAGHGSVSAQ